MLDVTQTQLDQVCEGMVVRLTDPIRHTKLILVRADQFDRLRQASVGLEVENAYALLADLDAEDWDDFAKYGGTPHNDSAAR